MILYVETNFAVGIAKGQDPDSASFLNSGDSDIAIVFPGVCFIEAFSSLSFDIKQKIKFYDELKRHSRGVKRNQDSWLAARLAGEFEQAIVDGEYLLRESEIRLKTVLYRISSGDGAIIAINHDIVQESLNNIYLDDLTDNLILCCILWHARRHPDEPKAFFSANHTDFGKPGSVEILKAAGVRYFKDIQSATGWLKSRPAPGPDPALPT